jgi:hypothetical protein
MPAGAQIRDLLDRRSLRTRPLWKVACT